MRRALIVGNSDGIGLALTRRLLAAGWEVTGVSRSASPLGGTAGYHHVVHDVTAATYRDALRAVLAARDPVDVCVYCVGIAEFLDPRDLAPDAQVFAVNLLGAVATAEVLVPAMVAARAGHFVALSSLADELVSAEAPSYAASKAALSAYVEGLALALRPHGVAVTNVRFGFVDTKMAKSATKPFMVSTEQAAIRVERCLETRPIRVSYPLRMAVLVRILRWVTAVRIVFG